MTPVVVEGELVGYDIEVGRVLYTAPDDEGSPERYDLPWVELTESTYTVGPTRRMARYVAQFEGTARNTPMVVMLAPTLEGLLVTVLTGLVDEATGKFEFLGEPAASEDYSGILEYMATVLAEDGWEGPGVSSSVTLDLVVAWLTEFHDARALDPDSEGGRIADAFQEAVDPVRLFAEEWYALAPADRNLHPGGLTPQEVVDRLVWIELIASVSSVKASTFADFRVQSSLGVSYASDLSVGQPRGGTILIDPTLPLEFGILTGTEFVVLGVLDPESLQSVQL